VSNNKLLRLIISLSSAIERRNFQQIQMEKLKLDFEFLEATSIHDIDMITYKKDGILLPSKDYLCTANLAANLSFYHPNNVDECDKPFARLVRYSDTLDLMKQTLLQC
jgi:hypothetical protein